MDPADLNSPCRELSNSGLEIAVTFRVCQQNIVCVLLADRQPSCIMASLYNFDLLPEWALTFKLSCSIS